MMYVSASNSVCVGVKYYCEMQSHKRSAKLIHLGGKNVNELFCNTDLCSIIVDDQSSIIVQPAEDNLKSTFLRNVPESLLSFNQ